MLGLIHHRLGNRTGAEKFLRQALQLQQSIRDKRSEGYTLTHMGWVLMAQQSYEAARQSFSQALTIRREVDEDGATAIDDLAGLTQIALALDDSVLAMKYATEIVDWFEQGDADRVEYPIQAYWVCYQTFHAASVSEPGHSVLATSVLREGHDLVQKRARRIQDAGLRNRFLTNVSFNRELELLSDGQIE